VLQTLRRRVQDEKGFTLIELLVVILIIGILAAIAIPSFINQRSKAQDASTKSMAKTAQTAMETYATDHSGDYTGADGAALATIEPTIPTNTSTNNYVTVDGTPDSTSYSVTAHNTQDQHTFTIARSAGTFSRTCTVGTSAPNNNSGGCVNGSW
jgi:type IV pilus assembly protein PilA